MQNYKVLLENVHAFIFHSVLGKYMILTNNIAKCSLTTEFLYQCNLNIDTETLEWLEIREIHWDVSSVSLFILLRMHREVSHLVQYAKWQTFWALMLPFCLFVCLFSFYWIFPFSTLQIFPPSCFALQKLPIPPPDPFLTEGAPPTHPATLSHLPALEFPFTGASSLHRIQELSYDWCPTRHQSAIHAAGAKGHSMCTLWLVF